MDWLSAFGHRWVALLVNPLRLHGIIRINQTLPCKFNNCSPQTIFTWPSPNFRDQLRTLNSWSVLMVEGHPLMTWPDAFSFGQDDSDCSTAPPVDWSYLLVPKLSSVGGLVYLKGWRRRKSKSLVYERQPTRFNHKQTGFHNHKLPGGSRCGTEAKEQRWPR